MLIIPICLSCIFQKQLKGSKEWGSVIGRSSGTNPFLWPEVRIHSLEKVEGQRHGGWPNGNSAVDRI